MIIYGDSGSTKTSQCYHLVRYFTSLHPGSTFRMIGANASDSAPFEDSGMIEKGTVDFFDISNRTLALADMRRLSEGYWPRDVKEAGKGNKQYFKTDDNCKTTAKQWENIIGYVVEGTTGIASLLLNHIRNQEEGVGFKHSFKYEEDGYTIGGLQEGHYGLVQQEMYKMIVQGFSCLPIKYLIFTGLVAKGEDKRTRETVYGPKAAGQATTFEIPSWFMDCWHLDTVVEQGEGDTQVERKVAWFTRHPDKETGVPYLAKVRTLPEIYPQVVKQFPNGYVKLGFKKGLDRFYEELNKIGKGEGQATTNG